LYLYNYGLCLFNWLSVFLCGVNKEYDNFEPRLLYGLEFYNNCSLYLAKRFVFEELFLFTCEGKFDGITEDVSFM
jgi:hypothetical protein